MKACVSLQTVTIEGGLKLVQWQIADELCWNIRFRHQLNIHEGLFTVYIKVGKRSASRVSRYGINGVAR